MKRPEEIKKFYLSNIGEEISNKLNPEHLLMLDETIENVVSGKDKFDDRIAQTDSEIFIIISYGMITRINALKGLISPLLEHDNTKVTISYRGKTFYYKS